MSIIAKVAYPAPQPQPQPIEAVLSPNVTISLTSNEAVFTFQEIMLAPDGKKTLSETSKRVAVLLSDAQLKGILTTVLTEAQAQGKMTDGTLLASSEG